MFIKKLLNLISPLGAGGVIGDVFQALLHLIFPHLCAGCGSDLLDRKHQLCPPCISSLPETSFHLHPANPVEKMFWGRLPLTMGTAQYYFTKESKMQDLVHQFKYHGHKELGIYLGVLMGRQLKQSGRFTDVDALIPLPLHAAREHKRGYNQSALLCTGIARVLEKPVLDKVVCRNQNTETQTHKNRIERWQNMEGSFTLRSEAAIENRHILLVDDVITTGASVEACGRELLKAKNVRLSVAALCVAK